MNAAIISECHSLELVPIERLERFARINSQAVIIRLRKADPAGEIPGTVKVSANTENGMIKKKITFDRAGVGPAATDRLKNYTVLRMIALYVDESGNRRVSGSPDHPLAFSFTIAGGVYQCVLEGSDTEPDAFL